VVAEGSLVELRAQGRVFQPTISALGSLFVYLRWIGVGAADVALVPSTSSEIAVVAFGRYLESERGRCQPASSRMCGESHCCCPPRGAYP
jgi:hypothetical protein